MPIIGHKESIADIKALLKNDRLGHGYVFFGPSMTGKKTLALGLAKFLEKGEFDAPVEGEVLQETMLIDLAFMKAFEPDTKDSIGIDAVREIRNFLWQKPNASTRRTLIIDEAELLTTQAQNALLKITEEPPVSSLLILVTSDIESIMPTILSRLPKVYFGPVAEKEVEKWLTETQEVAKVKAGPLAKRSLGKPGLAARLLNDKNFQKQLDTAEKFLKSSPTTRKDFIKKVIDPDDFSLRSFLDAVIITLAWEKPSKAKAALWHKALELQQNATNFGLNPRLQLENLLS